ncbi:MAG: hypothetical protein ACK4RM_02415 [Flavobacterium sp.]
MKNNSYGFLVFLIIMLSSCGPTLRIIAGFKDPKVESRESIKQYLSENKFEIETYFLKVENKRDSTEIFNRFLFGFNSDVYLFNTKTGDKYCFLGTEECSGVQMQEAFKNFDENYRPCTDESEPKLKDFLNILVNQNGEKVETNSLPEAEFYLFQTWNKYVESKKRFKENLVWLEELGKNSNKIEVIYVNTDLLDDWGLEKGKSLPIKIRRDGKKSVNMYFGSLPLAKQHHE